jgi:mannose-6-phosphate isomerase-like protein (cupin superfamily)
MNDFISRMGEGWGPNYSTKKKVAKRPLPSTGFKKHGYVGPIERQAMSNNDFRKVIYTAKEAQLVLMSLNPGEDIGMEVHHNVDQFFRIESGTGMVIINGRKSPIQNGSAFLVPRGAQHNVVNTGRTDLKLYTLYSPPNHRDKLIEKTKNIAERTKERFTGKTTE